MLMAVDAHVLVPTPSSRTVAAAAQCECAGSSSTLSEDHPGSLYQCSSSLLQ
jgi:hypothetical protein